MWVDGLFGRAHVKYRNPKVCSVCDNPCCEIYGRWRDTSMWFEDWCEKFHEHPESYGVQPLFDPLDVFMAGNEWKLERLRSQGINPTFCQYYGKDGCTIVWSKRPLTCTTFRCTKLSEFDIAEVSYFYPMLPNKS